LCSNPEVSPNDGFRSRWTFIGLPRGHAARRRSSGGQASRPYCTDAFPISLGNRSRGRCLSPQSVLPGASTFSSSNYSSSRESTSRTSPTYHMSAPNLRQARYVPLNGCRLCKTHSVSSVPKSSVRSADFTGPGSEVTVTRR
jgi:hypothetical protein